MSRAMKREKRQKQRESMRRLLADREAMDGDGNQDGTNREEDGRFQIGRERADDDDEEDEGERKRAESAAVLDRKQKRKAKSNELR